MNADYSWADVLVMLGMLVILTVGALVYEKMRQ